MNFNKAKLVFIFTGGLCSWCHRSKDEHKKAGVFLFWFFMGSGCGSLGFWRVNQSLLVYSRHKKPEPFDSGFLCILVAGAWGFGE